MRRNPPAVARWLLDRFGIPWRNESLMGDLVEEYRSGRSAMWFWRQTVVAIATMTLRDIRSHKLLALRAYVMSALLSAAWAWLTSMAEHRLVGAPNWLALITMFQLLTFLIWPGFVGWAVARAHRPYQAAMVLLIAAIDLILSVSFYITHPALMRLVYVEWNAVSWCAFLIGGFLQRPRERSQD